LPFLVAENSVVHVAVLAEGNDSTLLLSMAVDDTYNTWMKLEKPMRKNKKTPLRRPKEEIAK
jgi:hypothetical protein